MSRMPLLGVVLFIATRLALDGEVLDEGMVKLFACAGLRLATREVVEDDGADDGVNGGVDDGGLGSL